MKRARQPNLYPGPPGDTTLYELPGAIKEWEAAWDRYLTNQVRKRKAAEVAAPSRKQGR